MATSMLLASQAASTASFIVVPLVVSLGMVIAYKKRALSPLARSFSGKISRVRVMSDSQLPPAGKSRFGLLFNSPPVEASSAGPGSASRPLQKHYKANFKKMDASWGAKLHGVDPEELEQEHMDKMLHILTKQVRSQGYDNVHVALSVRRGCILLQLDIFQGNSDDADNGCSGGSSNESLILPAELMALLPAELRPRVTTVDVKSNGGAGAIAVASPCLGVRAGSKDPLTIDLRLGPGIPSSAPQFFLAADADPLESRLAPSGLYEVEAPRGGWTAPSVLSVGLEASADLTQVLLLPSTVLRELERLDDPSEWSELITDLAAILTLRDAPQNPEDQLALKRALSGIREWAQHRSLWTLTSLATNLLQQIHTASTSPSGGASAASHLLMKPLTLVFLDPSLERRYQQANYRGRIGTMTGYLLAQELFLNLMIAKASESLYGNAFHPLAWLLLPTFLLLSLAALVTRNEWVGRALLSYSWFIFVPSRLLLRQSSVCAMLSAAGKFRATEQLGKALGQSLMALGASYFITLPIVWKTAAIVACSSTIFVSYAVLPSCSGIGFCVPIVYMAAAYGIIPFAFRYEKADRKKFIASLAASKGNHQHVNSKKGD